MKDCKFLVVSLPKSTTFDPISIVVLKLKLSFEFLQDLLKQDLQEIIGRVIVGNGLDTERY